MACFEPTIDYVVTKIPRFAFEKFAEADNTLTTQMKSVGETMAIGRTFKGVFPESTPRLRGRCIRIRLRQQGSLGHRTISGCRRDSKQAFATEPRSSLVLRYALKSGITAEEIYMNSPHRPMVPRSPARDRRTRRLLAQCSSLAKIDVPQMRMAKQFGFSDRQLATMLSSDELEVRAWRKSHGIVATFKSVDTCAAEFEALHLIITVPTRPKMNCRLNHPTRNG